MSTTDKSLLQNGDGSPFEIRPFKNTIGAEVIGVNLRQRPSEAVLKNFEYLMAEHGFLVFKGQTELTGAEQVAISEYFGGRKIHSTHGVHPEAENRHIFRLSNNRKRGILGVGPQWHNDGSFLEGTFSHVGYYSVKAPKTGGETWFASTHKAYLNLSDREKEFWGQLVSINSNGGCVHPVVFEHKITKKKHVWLHLGMTGAVLQVYRDDEREPKLLNSEQMGELFNRYNDLLNDPALHRKHQYDQGDLVVIDNYSVAHRADKSAHITNDSDDDMLRILHRTTVKGTHPFHAENILPAVGYIDIQGPNPFNKDGVWQAGGLGFRWDKDIRMQN